VWLASAALVAVFLILVLAPGSARAAEGDPICVDCHNYVSLEVVDTWRSQNHGSNGVTCDVCHNTHDSDFRPFPTVEVCMGCHEVESIHQGFLPDTPAAACMDCHTSNVHLYPGQASWFYSGLTEEKLAGEDTDPTGEIAPSTGRRAAVVGAVIAVVLGLALGFLMDRFVRNL
jgi:hypothetical protein